MNTLPMYYHSMRLAFARRLTSKIDLFGRASLMTLFLFIWSKIWAATNQGASDFTLSSLVWYLMITEWIVLSVPNIYLEMETEIRSGDLSTALLRPGRWSLSQLATAWGIGLANWLVIGGWGMLNAWVITGKIPSVGALSFAGLSILALLAILSICVVMVIIGLMAIWLKDSSPLAWVWQKLLFVFGGLLLPLVIYPEWVQQWASWTPFPTMLGNIAAPVLGPIAQAPSLALTAAALVGWIILFTIVLLIIDRRGMRRYMEEA